MLHFVRVRLSGFKSFVEPTEIVIEPGLTGIVGPNGCGKSNVSEALRWAMGEISAKQMRGGEMDDVIFGGTQNRPPRNIAEVQIFLDNRERSAPAAFNESDELEIIRRIERGQGSSYRINGREVRARDVQLLLADAATGARSTALVGQGRVSALINAKPTDRRSLLEEAAGITGLHSRRHEAELRLRGAEANLERLDDVLQTMEGQLQGLKRQARQASRYRNISDHIRRAEAMLLHLRWRAALDALETAGSLFREAEQMVAELTGRVAAAATAEAKAAEALPALRMAEAEVAAELHRYAVARDALEAEERRTAEATAVVGTRLEQIAADRAREESLKADAAAAAARLAREADELTARQSDEAAAVAAAVLMLEEANVALAADDAALDEVVQEIAAGEAREAALKRQRSELEARRARLLEREREIGEECQRLEGSAETGAALEEARRAVASAGAHAETTRLAAHAAEDARAGAQAEEAACREALEGPQALASGLAAQVKALGELFAADSPAMWPPLIDVVEVEPGFEVALGAALGDDLAAPLDEGAPLHWRALPPLDHALALPAGCEPLSKHVRGPAALDRRLAQIGVVADHSTGRALSARLAQGQRLVAKDGALWRWDGFTVAAGAATPAAKRLGQKKELEALQHRLAEAQAESEAARAKLIARQDHARAALAAERRAREEAREAFAALNAAREAETRLAQRAQQQSARLATLTESAAQLALDLAEAERQAAEAAAALAALPDLAAARQRLASCRARLAETRQLQHERQSANDRLLGEAEARRERLKAIGLERQGWERRTAAAERQLAELAERKAAALREQSELAARPAEIAARRSALLDRIAEAELRRRQAADRLAAAEGRLAEADKALKVAESELHAVREERVRREAAVAAAEQARTAVVERIAERLECAPEACLELSGLKSSDALPELASIESRLQRLVNERENMGPVNLRAEAEAREVEDQIVSLQTERADLVGAIQRLRHGIAELNREGRERLMASFAAASEHFSELFTRLFGGGRAHLELTESPDPLEAGLEILASPPGKKLQVLSLLSGGEQALTALALLFAVFLTNPAPICVLDEVDAPLDDANVDRFCALLEEIARHSATRFLLITHHRMTMARMDRLFGVTMPERGVSQLVSVDLEAADSLRATA
ncbi:MAG: chromosome segregation protein SMC [Alphaproteobacteria bacterium]